MRFGLSYVRDPKDPKFDENLKSIISILKSRRHTIELEEDVALKHIKSKTILAIGDDSNILRTFRELGDKDREVLGINLGVKSFLGEIDVKDFNAALRVIEKKGYFIEKRSRLATEVDGKKLPYALNELAVSSSIGTATMRYGLKVDGDMIFRDFADGIIISTPTGSTGYALSAGGPVISTKSNVFLAIPICSINHNKPFVMNDNSKVEIVDISSRGKCEIVVDGGHRSEVDQNKITVKKAAVPAKFIRFSESVHSNVFRKLKNRSIETSDIPKDAPPSAKYILKVLQYEGSMTQKEIVDSSMLPARTVRSALSYLVKKGLIAQRTSIRDTRQSIYFVM